MQSNVQPDAVLQEALVELRSNGNHDEHATKRKQKFAIPNTKDVNNEKEILRNFEQDQKGKAWTQKESRPGDGGTSA